MNRFLYLIVSFILGGTLIFVHRVHGPKKMIFIFIALILTAIIGYSIVKLRS